MSDRDLLGRFVVAYEQECKRKKRQREEKDEPWRHFVINLTEGGIVHVNGQRCKLEIHEVLDKLQPDILGCTETPRARTWTVRVKNFDERSKTVKSFKEFMESF
jgi:hypothetical protein